MTKEFLSQDEVDALLKGVSGDADEAPPQEATTSGPRPYNLATDERIVRGRMPTLEMINERFARQLRPALFNFLRRGADISLAPPRVVKYADFVRNLVVPTNLNLLQLKPLRGTALFIIDPNLVFLIVDTLFGGSGQYHTRVEGRDFTQTEMRVVRRLLDIAIEEYERTWKPVLELKIEYMRSEMNTQFANIATPNEVVIVSTLTIEFGSAGGEFHVCIPYTMLEPIRDILYSNVQTDQSDFDKRLVSRFTHELQCAEVEMVVNLGSASVSVEQLLNMQPGDVVALDVPEVMTGEIDGLPVLEGKCGVVGGQYAFRVDRMLKQAAR